MPAPRISAFASAKAKALQPTQSAKAERRDSQPDVLTDLTDLHLVHAVCRPKMPPFELLRRDKKDNVKRLLVKAAITKNKEIKDFLGTLLTFKNDHNAEVEYKPAGHLIEQYIDSVKHIQGCEHLAEHLSGTVKDMWIT